MYDPPLKPPRPFEAARRALRALVSNLLRRNAPHAGGMEQRQMGKDGSPPTSKDDRSPLDGLSAAEWWEEARKPSRQRKLSPQQRKSLADDLRALRAARRGTTLNGVAVGIRN